MLFSFRRQLQAQIHLSFSAELVRILRILSSAVQTGSDLIAGARRQRTALLIMPPVISGRGLVTTLQRELIALSLTDQRFRQAATEPASPGRGLIITPASSPAFLQTVASWV